MGWNGTGRDWIAFLVCPGLLLVVPCWSFASLVLEASTVSYHVVFLLLSFFRLWRDKVGIRCLHALYLKLNGVVFSPPPCDSGGIGLGLQCLHQSTKVFCFSAEFLATQACLSVEHKAAPTFCIPCFLLFWCDRSNCMVSCTPPPSPAFSCSPLLIKSNPVKSNQPF